MSYDDSADIAYNPFAEEDDPSAESNLPQGYYSSAFFPKLTNSRPTLRRRRSSLTDNPSIQVKAERKRHLRSRTEIEIVPNSAGLHPLRSALAGTIGAIFLEDSGVTRPHLSRIISEGTLVDAPSLEDDAPASKSPSSANEEKDVMVHQVTSKDSLAGVSLKYGISMANLRRANQLWTSDSIHRRDVLYIPIDQATRARKYIPEPNLISLTPPNETTNLFEEASTSTLPANGDNTESSPPSPSVPILRLPARQLSYFPPSSNKNPDIRANGYTETGSLRPAGGLKISPGLNRYSPSPANSSLTSILTALPIAASTRDEIITRLSFDSVSSSFSDRSRTNSDEDDGHELDDVAKHKRPEGHESGSALGVDELSMPTPRASQRPYHARIPHPTAPPVTTSSSIPKTSHTHSLSSTSPPRFYVSQANETYVRTSQLEPSPAMQLPDFRGDTVGRSSGKTLQGNREMERSRTNSITGKTTKPSDGKEGDLGLMLERLQVNGLG